MVEKIRRQLTLQDFMNDMQMIGNQVQDRDLKKPTFDYGHLSITNYLLWLTLAELKILNKNKKE